MQEKLKRVLKKPSALVPRLPYALASEHAEVMRKHVIIIGTRPKALWVLHIAWGLLREILGPQDFLNSVRAQLTRDQATCKALPRKSRYSRRQIFIIITMVSQLRRRSLPPKWFGNRSSESEEVSALILAFIVLVQIVLLRWIITRKKAQNTKTKLPDLSSSSFV